MKNYYEILELDPTASKEEIKQAYTRLCKQVMQKKRNNELCEPDFFQILDAYSILYNDKKRSLYDSKLKQGIKDFVFKEESLVEDSLQKPATDREANTKRKVLTGLAVVIGAFVLLSFFFLKEDSPKKLETTAKIAENKTRNIQAENKKSAEDTSAPKQPDENKFLLAEDKRKPATIVKPEPAKNKPEPVPSFSKPVSIAEPQPGKNRPRPVPTIHHNHPTTRTIHEQIATEIKAPSIIDDEQPSKQNVQVKVTKKISQPQLIKKAEDNVVITKNTTVDKGGKKQLGKEELLGIVNSILNEKTNTENAPNCIRVVQSLKSNVANPFDVVPLLQAKGLVISGRGFTKETADGIKVNFNNNCLLLTIGRIDLQKEVTLETVKSQENIQPVTQTASSKIALVKTLSEAEMMDIVNSIVTDPTTNNNPSSCIRVMQSVDSNIKNAFDIIPLLMAKGFIISERGYTKEAFDKVKVDHSKPCISLTIGTF